MEIRQIFWQGLRVTQHVFKLLGHIRWIFLVNVNAQCFIAIALVSVEPLNDTLMKVLVYLAIQFRWRRRLIH